MPKIILFYPHKADIAVKESIHIVKMREDDFENEVWKNE